MTTNFLRRYKIALAAVVVALFSFTLAACSDDDNGDTTTGDTQETDTEAESNIDTTDNEGAAGEQSGNVVEIIMRDYEFANVPASVPAGTQLKVVNEADGELHEAVAFRLPDDEQRPVSELVTLDEGELTAILGEPVAVLLAAPSGPQIDAVGDGTLTEPGRYAIICFIPTGADVDAYLQAAGDPDAEGPPEVDGGPPHFVHGMYAELTVE